MRVDIPRKDTLAPPNGNGHANGFSSDKVTPSQDDGDDEPTVPVTLTGPQPLAYEAQALLNQIISSRTSKSSQRVRDIPVHVLPFIVARKTTFQAVAEGSEVTLALNAGEREITVCGDREAVVRVVDTIKATIDGFKTGLTSLKISLPKRQHRLLVGKVVDEIMSNSKCAVLVAKPDDPSDEVTVWGQGADLPAGLGAVMEQANSQYIHEFPIPGPTNLSKQLLTYITCIQYSRTLCAAHPGVSVFTPPPTAVEKVQNLNIEIVGEKSAVDGAVREVSELIGKLTSATKEVLVDWLVHRVIIGKNAKRYSRFLSPKLM